MTNQSKLSPIHTPEVAPARRRISWQRWALMGVLLTGFVWLLPWLAGVTPLRNVIIRAVGKNPNVTTRAGTAMIGWTRPVSVYDLRIERKDGGLIIDVPKLETEKSLWRIWSSHPDLGDVFLHQPVVRFNLLNQPAELTEYSQGPSRLVLQAKILDATVVVHSERSDCQLFRLDRINVDAVVREGTDSESGRFLTIPKTRLVNHHQLTTELVEDHLRLIAPLLSGSTYARGEYSIQLNDFQLPLDESDPEARLRQTQLDAKVVLHDVAVGGKGQVFAKVVRTIAMVTGKQLPNRLQVARGCEVAVQVRDGRVFHQGLAVGLPEMSEELMIRSQGSVGIDESLDLELTIPIPKNLVRDRPLLASLAERPIRLRVVGTLQDPQVELPERSEWVDQLTRGVLQRLQANREPSEPAGESGASKVPFASTNGQTTDASPVSASLVQELARLLASRATSSNLPDRQTDATPDASASHRETDSAMADESVGGWLRKAAELINKSDGVGKAEEGDERTRPDSLSPELSQALRLLQDRLGRNRESDESRPGSPDSNSVERRASEEAEASSDSKGGFLERLRKRREARQKPEGSAPSSGPAS